MIKKATLMLSGTDVESLRRLLRETAEQFEKLRDQLICAAAHEAVIRADRDVKKGDPICLSLSRSAKAELRERYEKAEDCFDRVRRSIKEIENFKLIFPVSGSNIRGETLELSLDTGQLFEYRRNLNPSEEIETESGKKAYKITNERIDTIKPARLDTLTTEQNIALTQRCGELLQRCRDDEVLSERGFLLSESMRIICSAHQLDLEDDDDKQRPSVNLVYLNTGVGMIHNHPYGNGFSRRDLITLYAVDTLKFMGAVGNNGKTYFVEKTAGYDKERFGRYLLDCERLESIIADADKFGVKFYKYEVEA